MPAGEEEEGGDGVRGAEDKMKCSFLSQRRCVCVCVCVCVWVLCLSLSLTPSPSPLSLSLSVTHTHPYIQMFNTSAWTHTPKPNTLLLLHLLLHLLLQKHQNKKPAALLCMQISRRPRWYFSILLDCITHANQD